MAIGLIGQPQTLNPITENNSALRELTPLLFDALLQADPTTARLQPRLARSWEFSDDGRQVVFQLPANLKWSDGSPLTAAGIVESLQATQHPALQEFSRIDAPNTQTLSFTFSTIDCSALTTLALLPLLPASQILAPNPPGSGPFIAAEWTENQRALALIPNPYYRAGPLFLDGLTIRFIKEAEVDSALSKGDFDVFGPLEGVNSNPFGSFAKLTYPAPQVVYIAINYAPRNESPIPLRVRQALTLALDREAMLNEVLKGEGELMAGSLLPGHWAANPALSPPQYDPEEARQLLAEASLKDSNGDGWLDQNGERMELAVRVNGQNPLHQRLGWLASSYYRALGLFARAESVPPDSVIDDLFTHDFRLAIFRWPLLPDPDQRLFWRSAENTEGIGLNFTSYNNSQVDELLEKGVAVSGCQPDDRVKIYHELEQILSAERPVDFLLTPNRHLFVSPRLNGLNPGPFAPFTWNAAEWHIK